jgi:2-phosphosulfolactate phosphatase
MTKEEIDPERLEGHVAVVIDVVLATTTMISLMERGARRVYPAGSTEEIAQLKDSLEKGQGQVLTGGEHQGYKIEGFDYGPEPREYTEEIVAGKDILFLSSNGTRAISRTRLASRVLLASLRNAPVVANYLADTVGADQKLFILCSGSGGQLCLEDFYCAGLILQDLGLSLRGVPHNDAAQLALDYVQSKQHLSAVEVLKQSRVGQHFLRTEQLELLNFAGDYGVSSTLVEVKDRFLYPLAYA